MLRILHRTLAQAAPKYDYTDSTGARFLRKREADEENDLTAEERNFAKNLYSKIVKKNALKLFTKTNDQLAAKKYSPSHLFDALKTLRKSGVPEEKLVGLLGKADDWSDHWYRTAGHLDPVRN
ncbi:hypothetical protein PHYSODRAFT_306271 [Phytophthora sojae]|uniref:RxLR effector protein n=1 Tax=Phytophthora sojae (strain P6497) TaxID=1094619 RepID=G5A8S6_PHYSP|nr:hypothetical protein PHYSODRAFT_306271 [Phytophthora sojae]EGZ08302.1 hypothetical protein PHYSODRAFT_306271 [Phytophthora sojae]|eukprot:XP_009536474.1 hypothetical protein PHYSODRAFT_306271 [Phytophthora sojae]